MINSLSICFLRFSWEFSRIFPFSFDFSHYIAAGVCVHEILTKFVKILEKIDEKHCIFQMKSMCEPFWNLYIKHYVKFTIKKTNKQTTKIYINSILIFKKINPCKYDNWNKILFRKKLSILISKHYFLNLLFPKFFRIALKLIRK